MKAKLFKQWQTPKNFGTLWLQDYPQTALNIQRNVTTNQKERQNVPISRRRAIVLLSNKIPIIISYTKIVNILVQSVAKELCLPQASPH